MVDKIVIETLPSGETKTYVIPTPAPQKLPTTGKFTKYATVQHLAERGFPIINGIPTPITDGGAGSAYQEGYSEDGLGKNYVPFYYWTSNPTSRQTTQAVLDRQEIYRNQTGKPTFAFHGCKGDLCPNWTYSGYLISNVLTQSKNISAITRGGKLNNPPVETSDTMYQGLRRTDFAHQPELDEASIQTSGAGQARKPPGAGATIPIKTQIDEPISDFTFDILPEAAAEPQQVLSNNTQQILNDIDAGLIQVPDWFHNNIKWVKSGHITEQTFLTAYNQQVKVGNIHLLEQKETWWVIRPSGLIEQVTVTQKFVDRMTGEGWIFSKDKPIIEEPQNQNISIVFYIGKGGDLKTHFNINSIIVTPDEAEQLAGWLYSNYNTRIIFVMNRLTDDVRTHTVQQLKDMIIQKLKDEKDDSDDIDDDDIKKPKELGFMSMGITGAIALLIGIGLILPERGRKK